jgi:hypothetical protein
MSLGDPALAKPEDLRQAERHRLSSPGMADWVDIDNTKHCASCAYFDHKRCGLFARIMRARGASQKYRGIELPPGQRACRRYEPRRERRYDNGSYFQQEVNDMPKVSEKYAKRGLLTAKDLAGQPDLIVTVSHVDYDVPIGGERFGDVVHFVEDGRGLVLGQVIANQIADALGKDEIADWPGSRIALFCDDTVEYKDRMGNIIRGGVRARPRTPQGNGPAPALPARRQQMDDEVSF